MLQKEEARPAEREKAMRSMDLGCEDCYFPSVNLLTAQVHTRSKLLSFTNWGGV